MKKLIILNILIFLLPVSSSGATLFFDPPGKIVKEGEDFSIDFSINPNDDFINAMEGTIIFPERLLKVSGIEISDSIVNVWIQNPVVKNGEISFSGIVPGGFDGVRKALSSEKYPGLVFRIFFKAKKSGSGAIVIEDQKILLNDGGGGEVLSSTIPFAVNITESSAENQHISLPIVLLIVIIICISGVLYMKKK